MKKTLLVFASVMLAAVTSSAQMKVDLDGNTHMGNALEDDHAILNVGSSPYDTENDYEWGYRLGIHGERYNTTGNKDVIGVFGEAYQTNVQNTWSTYGVWGFSRNYGGRCYGVMGSIVSGYGVGVFGTDEYSPRYYVPGYYAGYFQGTTYVDGDILQPEESSSLGTEESSLCGQGRNSLFRQAVLSTWIMEKSYGQVIFFPCRAKNLKQMIIFAKK